MTITLQTRVTRLAVIQQRLRDSARENATAERCPSCRQKWHKVHVCGKPAWTYRFYADDVLIYVGKTVNLHERIADHRRSAKWFGPQINQVRAVLHPSEDAAYEDEADWILGMEPPGNLASPAHKHRR